jgi:NAD(P)-dependent dehydrogenase (short-subunit alcohol dehydrogenase family)
MQTALKRILRRISRRFKKVVPVHIPVLKDALLNNRVALVTGATSGIGRAIAEAFVASGATVIVAGRNPERVQATCIALRTMATERADSRIVGAILDLAVPETHATAIDSVLPLLGGRRIDILVNNAGVLGSFDYGGITAAQFDAVFNTNVRGTYLLTQLVVQHMLQHRVSGNILNIASSSSLRPALSPYTVSKWAMRGLTLGLAKTLIPHDIVVNGLAPGPTATPMLVADDYDGIELPQSPIGRYATAAEIAQMAVILVSGLGRMIVGDTVYMTGGAGVVTVDDIQYRVRESCPNE